MFYLIDQAKLDVVIIDAKMLQGDLDLSNNNSVKNICIYGQTKWKVILRNKITKNLSNLNRYRRGLETCPQAKTSKSGNALFFFFFPTRPSDEYDSAPSQKYSRPLLDVFACID